MPGGAPGGRVAVVLTMRSDFLSASATFPQLAAVLSAHQELATLAEQRDQIALAAEHYEKAWMLKPDERSLLLDMGRVWKTLGKAERANAALLAASRGAQPRVAEQARELLPVRYPYVYEFEGALQLEIDARAPQTFKAGDVFFVPAGVVHNGRNTGSVKTMFVSTYVVENGQPLSAPAK